MLSCLHSSWDTRLWLVATDITEIKSVSSPLLPQDLGQVMQLGSALLVWLSYAFTQTSLVLLTSLWQMQTGVLQRLPEEIPCESHTKHCVTWRRATQSGIAAFEEKRLQHLDVKPRNKKERDWHNPSASVAFPGCARICASEFGCSPSDDFVTRIVITHAAMFSK